MQTQDQPKKLTPEQVEKEINRRNKLFKGKTAAEKRVLICKDVIQQIQNKAFIPVNGTFVDSNILSEYYSRWLDSGYDDYGNEGLEENKDLDIRKILIQDKPQCNCCGLGSLVLSCTLFNNKSKLSNYYDDFEDLGDTIRDERKISNQLNLIFPKEDLERIEVAFERGFGYFRAPIDDEFDSYDNHSTLSKDDFNKCAAFGKKYKISKNRLIAICENIIKNKGTFKP